KDSSNQRLHAPSPLKRQAAARANIPQAVALYGSTGRPARVAADRASAGVEWKLNIIILSLIILDQSIIILFCECLTSGARSGPGRRRQPRTERRGRIEPHPR